jgi:fucose permease
MTTKTSILVFYLSLSKTQKIFRWATFGTLAVVNVGGLALTLLNIMQCQPVQAAWETPVSASASCTNIVTIYLSSAPLNIITDLTILFLPMPILTSMRLPRKQKTILVVTFGFGVFVAVVDVVRIAYLQVAARANLHAIQNHRPADGSDSRNDNDFSWYAALTFMWSAIEINVGIMCGCVPALKPLFSRFLPHWILDHTMREKTATQTSDSMGMHPDLAESPKPSRRNSPADVSPTKPVLAPDRVAEPTMDLMAFLTTPDMNEIAQSRPSNTYPAYATAARRRKQSMTFFDFVDTKRKKNITLMNNRESVYPILMVTILFFIWGFAYGLLDTLNGRFQEVARMSAGQTVGQHSAYYLGYLVGPLTFGRLVFRHWGFKACYTVGLGVYACGTLVFWPSAVLTSFPAFLISNFITGLGLSTLEISANPFIALCGPPEYAEVRLSVSQGIQAIGTILSPLLAKKVLFKASANSLIDVQWTYLGITFFTVMLAIVYYYVPLPEATDQELEEASARLAIPRDATVGSTKVKVIWVTLALGVFSQFCYVGGQESTSTTFTDYINYVMPSLDTVNHMAIGHTVFAVSRFISAFMNFWLKPRYILLFFYMGAIAFAAACMNGLGRAPSSLIIMLMLFEGPLFPIIYVQPLRGMGKHTKDAAVLLTAAIGGGSVFPPIMYAATKARNVQFAFCIIVAVYAAGTLFPLYLNIFGPARPLSDPVRDEHARRESVVQAQRRAIEKNDTEKKGRRRSILSLLRRYSSRRDSLPTVEHRERVDSAEQSQPPPPPSFVPNDPIQEQDRPPSSKDNDSSGSGSASLAFETTPAWLSGGANGNGSANMNGSARGGPSRLELQESNIVDFQRRPAWLEEGAERGGPSLT